MPLPLSGPGVGLPFPQQLYPTELGNAPIDNPSNRVTLAPGQVLPLPAGDWYISLNSYLVVQYLDPVTQTWSMGATPGWQGGIVFVTSDGFNFRLANLLACPISASITSGGDGNYVQSSTTITVTGGGGSTWQPIIGGALGTTGTFSIDVTNKGGGYGIAPILLIPPPPGPANNSNGVGGVQAHGYVSIASGTINGVTLTNPGAGYPTAPTCVVVTNPADPNISTGITQGAVAFSLVNAGSLTGVLCTGNGAPLATPANITLTVNGAGATASCVANVLQTITKASVTGGGAGWGTVACLLTTVGGGPNAGTIANNPEGLGLAFRPRQADIGLAVSGANGSLAASQAGTIYDGGLFLSAPTAVLAPSQFAGTAGSVLGPTIVLTMGSRQDFAIVQPAP